jgi:hypothetical protein
MCYYRAAIVNISAGLSTPGSYMKNWLAMAAQCCRLRPYKWPAQKKKDGASEATSHVGGAIGAGADSSHAGSSLRLLVWAVNS